MARAPTLTHDAAVAVVDQIALALRLPSPTKSFDEAPLAHRIELDFSLPVRILGPSASLGWNPSVDISAQALRTAYWHHQVRFQTVVDRYATSRFAAGGAVPRMVSITQPSSLAHSIDTMVTRIDHELPDDAYLASILKVPTHAVLAILLSNDQRESQLFVVASPRSFDRVLPGTRYRASGHFLEDLNGERAGGGYRPSQGASEP